MLQKNKLRAKMCEMNYSMENISRLLGIKSSTLYRKMNGKSEFNRAEIEQLVKILKLDNPSEIFFAN